MDRRLAKLLESLANNPSVSVIKLEWTFIEGKMKPLLTITKKEENNE